MEKGDKVREVFPTWMVKKEGWEFTIPAYTLQDVLDALPTEIRLGQERCWLAIDVTDETVGYYYEENVRISPQWAYYDVIEYGESLIDALYRLLCWAIENKFVETNKNE